WLRKTIMDARFLDWRRRGQRERTCSIQNWPAARKAVTYSRSRVAMLLTTKLSRNLRHPIPANVRFAQMKVAQFGPPWMERRQRVCGSARLWMARNRLVRPG